MRWQTTRTCAHFLAYTCISLYPPLSLYDYLSLFSHPYKWTHIQQHAYMFMHAVCMHALLHAVSKYKRAWIHLISGYIHTYTFEQNTFMSTHKRTLHIHMHWYVCTPAHALTRVHTYTCTDTCAHLLASIAHYYYWLVLLVLLASITHYYYWLVIWLWIHLESKDYDNFTLR
jgi:hypothetical protein